MRLVFTIGRMTLIDISLFAIQEVETDPDVVVVHHYNDDEEDTKKPDGPEDLFGDK